MENRWVLANSNTEKEIAIGIQYCWGGGLSGIVLNDDGNGYSINNIQINLDLT